MGDETFITGGYVLGEDLDIGGVAQVDTALNQDDNMYTVRFYGRNGELIQEQQVAANLADLNAVTTVSEDDILHGDTEPGLRIPYMTLNDDGLNYYGEDGDLLWRADRTMMYAQSTSSNEYHMAGRNFDIEEIFGPYDTDTRMDDDERYGNPYVRRYVEGELRDRAEEHLRMTYGTRTELREDFIRARNRHLDEIFLKGEWKIPQEEEQPDIQEERGGALDEFLEKFTPQKTTPERSDEQE